MMFSFSSQYLADIEEHLGVTIQQVDKEMKVPVDEFDGKVVYGEKRSNAGEWLKRKDMFNLLHTGMYHAYFLFME